MERRGLAAVRVSLGRELIIRIKSSPFHLNGRRSLLLEKGSPNPESKVSPGVGVGGCVLLGGGGQGNIRIKVKAKLSSLLSTSAHQCDRSVENVEYGLQNDAGFRNGGRTEQKAVLLFIHAKGSPKKKKNYRGIT